MKAKKHLGQHFLTSRAVIKDMLKVASPKVNEIVVEVGPGKGVLTEVLLKTGARVIAIETDPDMVRVLKSKFSDQIHSQQLTLVEGDILKIAIEDYTDSEYKVVANIPYYITGVLLRKFLSAIKQPSSITVLIQKEVAQRIAKSKKENC